MSNAGDDWWRGCVIYQIYPRSFQDSTGDGSGDLAGITARLPHVASLGVDAIWLSPFFKSPMADMGYDVSDYCAVDPMFGTIEDFDRLVAEAHRLGLKVIIDQVLSHTSDQHPWFKESRASRDNPKADWYVWADPKPDGTAPNNWLSVFGGPAWEWDGTRKQYYMHNFLASQPDLNFHNPEVQDALLETVRFWLERGVDGFRLDTVNYYFHDRKLRNNPPMPRGSMAGIPDVNPYGYQNHLHDKTQPENLAFLKRFRALLDELWRARGGGRGRRRGPLAGDGRRLHVGRRQAADVLHLRPARPRILRRACQEMRERLRGSGRRRLDLLGLFQPRRDAPCLALDQAGRRSRRGRRNSRSSCWSRCAARSASTRARSWGWRRPTRVRGSARSLRHPLLAGLQGPRRLPHADGLGKRQAECRLHAPASRGCRCPRRIAAVPSTSQQGDPASVLAHYRAGAGLPPRQPALVGGTIEFLAAEGDVLAFIRATATSGCSASSTSPASRRNGPFPAALASRRSSKGPAAARASRQRRSRSTRCRPASRGSARRGRVLRAPDQFYLYPPARLPFRNLLSFHAQASFVGTTEADEYETLRIS